MSRGKVILIGAGPGDPGLITLKGAEALARADVVVYDRLVGHELLELARDHAELIDVGKRPGSPTLPQDEINRLLVEKALAGKTVARLKGGDPFLFGRGGEEAEALAERGVNFEVVPGVSSVVAVPAYAGIPVTHRDHSSSVHIIAGQQDGRSEPLDWGLLGQLEGTLVFLMGVKTLPDIAANLIRGGKAPGTPVAVIERGTLPSQRTISGTLEDIAAEAAAAGVRPPAVTVVGGVASLAGRLGWRRVGPLAGRTVVVTRAKAQAGPLVRRLRDHGADVLALPLITVSGPAVYDQVDRVLGRLGEFTHLVFTSPNGVGYFWTRLLGLGVDVRRLAGLRFCAVGPGTAGALADRGVVADVVPGTSTTAYLLERLRVEPVGSRFLLARSDLADPGLADGLRKAGHRVEDVAFYRTRPGGSASGPAIGPGAARGADLASLTGGRPADYITFTSPSTVLGFMDLAGAGRAAWPRATFVYIGPVTAQAARKAGLPEGLEANPHTIDGVVQAILDHVGRK